MVMKITINNNDNDNNCNIIIINNKSNNKEQLKDGGNKLQKLINSWASSKMKPNFCKTPPTSTTGTPTATG